MAVLSDGWSFHAKRVTRLQTAFSPSRWASGDYMYVSASYALHCTASIRRAFQTCAPAASLTDVAALTMAQRSDDTILDALFRMEAPRLARFLRRRVRGADETQDLVQEAFVRLAGIGAGRLHGKPEAYLQRIARNLLADRGRRRARFSEICHVPVAEAERIGMPADQSWDLDAKDLMKRYREALNELPARTQEVFLLHRVNELSYGEIATRLGVTVKAIEYHIGKALAHLDQALLRE